MPSYEGTGKKREGGGGPSKRNFDDDDDKPTYQSGRKGKQGDQDQHQDKRHRSCYDGACTHSIDDLEAFNLRNSPFLMGWILHQLPQDAQKDLRQAWPQFEKKDGPIVPILKQRFEAAKFAVADLLHLLKDGTATREVCEVHLGNQEANFIFRLKQMLNEGKMKFLPDPQPPANSQTKYANSGSIRLEPLDVIQKHVPCHQGRKVCSAKESCPWHPGDGSVPPTPMDATFAANPLPSIGKAPAPSHWPEPASDWVNTNKGDWPPSLVSIRNKKIEEQVYTHKSVIDGADSGIGAEGIHNERFEWLGDSHLGAVVTSLIYNRFPDMREGDMSQLRSNIVGNKNIRNYGFLYKMDEKIRTGNNKKAEVLAREKTVSDLFEAYCGGVSVDRGPGVFYQFIEALIDPMLVQEEVRRKDMGPVDKAAKNRLNQLVGGKEVRITYETLPGGGPATGFEIAVKLNGWGFKDIELGRGKGSNKTDAGLRAAANVLKDDETMAKVQNAKAKVLGPRPSSRAQQSNSQPQHSNGGNSSRKPAGKDQQKQQFHQSSAQGSNGQRPSQYNQNRHSSGQQQDSKPSSQVVGGQALKIDTRLAQRGITSSVAKEDRNAQQYKPSSHGVGPSGQAE